jgi:hypothetical protein
LVGSIHGPDQVGRTGAQILAYHLSSQQLFTSAPADAKGHYELTGLPRGYFDIAVRTSEGLYVAGQVIELAFEGKAVLFLSLTAAESAASMRVRRFAGSEEPVAGVAELQRKNPTLRGKTRAALLAGGGALALLALGGGTDSSASPSSP